MKVKIDDEVMIIGILDILTVMIMIIIMILKGNDFQI